MFNDPETLVDEDIEKKKPKSREKTIGLIILAVGWGAFLLLAINISSYVVITGIPIGGRTLTEINKELDIIIGRLEVLEK